MFYAMSLHKTSVGWGGRVVLNNPHKGEFEFICRVQNFHVIENNYLASIIFHFETLY